LLDDAALSAGLAKANVPTLLMLIVALTGEMSWLDPSLQPRRPRGLGDDDTGGLSADLQEQVREEARRAIKAWWSGTPLAIADPSDDLLVRMLSFSLGEPVPSEYGPMMSVDLREQLANVEPLASETQVAPSGEPEAWPDGFTALVIGAGPSGLAAAVKLGAAGIPYRVIEKNSEVAGTWLLNEYPGAAVDTPSHLYSFTFAPWDWSRYFAGRDELASYLGHVADKYDVRRHIQFESEMVSASYDVAGQCWQAQIQDRFGVVHPTSASILITAVGALNRPTIPDIPGIGEFAGPAFHTARWPRGLEIAGKRIAVIGTGASAMQLVPAISDTVGSVTVFQRSPQWAAPFDRFHVEIPDELRRVMMHVPLYTAWYRLRQAWIFNDKIYPTLQKDPSWPHPDRAVNAVNDSHREYFTRYIVSEIGDRTDLLPKVLPTYPPFSKRMLLDNGWFRTMRKPNVHLETTGISRIESDRIVTTDGTEHAVDIIVFATGFDALHFLAPMDIRGRSGASLSATWDGDDARAYLGLAVHDFPNLFCLYGPNTQTAHGGSLMYLSECQLRYILDLLRSMRDKQIGSVECRQEVFDDYNGRVDEAHENMIWTHPGVSTYYRNARGRVVMNSPWRVVDFWSMTRQADLEDFTTEPSVQRGEPSAVTNEAS
jgi:4-hydroxyacetophenone monooxygenase